MIKLQTTFVSGDGGFGANPLTYTQLARTETIAVYERSRNGKPYDYEVFQIKILKKGTQVFKSIAEDDQEKYPGGSSFGKWAWSIASKERAIEQFEKLCKGEDAPEEDEDSVKKDLIIPVGEFTTNEFASSNSMEYPKAFVLMKGVIESGLIKFLREERRNAKGKLSKIYIKA